MYSQVKRLLTLTTLLYGCLCLGIHVTEREVRGVTGVELPVGYVVIFGNLTSMHEITVHPSSWWVTTSSYGGFTNYGQTFMGRNVTLKEGKGFDDSTLIMEGILEHLNAELAPLRYRSDIPWADNITIVARDLESGEEATARIEVYTQWQPEVEGLPIWQVVIYWVIIFVLVLLSGTYSGVNLGLLSLDLNMLDVIIDSGKKRHRKWAKRIKPIRRQGNLLICTILMGNVAINAAMSILMSEVTTPLIGFLSSTILITIVGEIVPQSIFARYALASSYYTLPLMLVSIVVLFVFCYPMSWLLDRILGKEMGMFYTKRELKQLISIHEEAIHTDLTHGEGKMMRGVLGYRELTVADIMTDIEKAFMLDADERLDTSLVANVLEAGFSRIPIYEGDRNNVISMIYMKDMALVNSEEGPLIRSLLPFFGRKCLSVHADELLDEVFGLFKSERIHVAVVHRVIDDGERDPYYKNVGIISLEDILETIIQEEIVDEYEDKEVGSGDVVAGRINNYKRFVGLKPIDLTEFKEEEIDNLIGILTNSSEDIFSEKNVGEDTLRKMLRLTEIVKLNRGDILYKRGARSDFCCVVLSGKLEVISGESGFRSVERTFSVMSPSALIDSEYIPDFNGRVISDSFEYLRITRGLYDSSVKATLLDKGGAKGSFPAGGGIISNITSSIKDKFNGEGEIPYSKLGGSVIEMEVTEEHIREGFLAVPSGSSGSDGEEEEENEETSEADSSSGSEEEEEEDGSQSGKDAEREESGSEID